MDNSSSSILEKDTTKERNDDSKKIKTISSFTPSRIILAFIFLALGFIAISVDNLLNTHSPEYFFNIYTQTDLIIYYTAITVLTPLGFLSICISVFILILEIFSRLTTIKISDIKVEFPEDDFESLREKASREPDKVEPIWDLGRANLQQYFNLNLQHNRNIYRFSVVIMSIGFALISVCIVGSFVLDAKGNSFITPVLIGSLSGVITEFIGATFLFIYRSNIQQANNYLKTLERINSVGMATKILDTISNDSHELRDKTKADIVKLLFTRNLEREDDEKIKK